MSTQAWTVGRLLEWTTGYLKDHGAESPRLDAEVLLAESLRCERIALYTSFLEEPPEEAKAVFREFVRRRAAGEPVAYLVGKKEFYSLVFEVSSRVLIPRPETEFLVVAALDAAKALGKEPVEICDIGTGSGAIAVCLAKHLPHAAVTAVDISREALEVARNNARRHAVENRIEFLQSDLFEAVPLDKRFDIVASNPPYVSEAEYEALAPDVKNHEPRQALLAGSKGTEVIERILNDSAGRLRSGGSLLLEVSPMIHDAVVRLIEAEPQYTAGPSIKDLSRLPRVVQASRLKP